jgi:hypothetical protein
MMTDFLIWLLQHWVDKFTKNEIVIAHIGKDTIRLCGAMREKSDDYFYKRVRGVYLHTLEEKR